MSQEDTVTRSYSLNAKQVHILKLAYKFRFLTAPLLAEYKQLKSRNSMYLTLERLANQGYIGKRIEANTDFKNKGIRYYLTPLGFNLLKDEHGMSDSNKFAMYKNKSVAESFIDRYTDTLRVYLALRDSYPNKFHIYTESDLLTVNDFEKHKPNLYLRRVNDSQQHPTYFLEIQSESPMYLVKKRFAELIDGFEDGNLTNDEDLRLLYVLDSASSEKNFTHHANTVLENTGIDDLPIYTTTLKALTEKPLNKAVWSNTASPNALTELD